MELGKIAATGECIREMRFSWDDFSVSIPPTAKARATIPFQYELDRDLSHWYFVRDAYKDGVTD